VRAVIGIGSNLGDRAATLREAIERVKAIARVERTSRVYETEPVGPPQPHYLNAAIAIETDLAPRALMDALLAIEHAMGRVRVERWGPRTIDLDVLWIDGVTCDDAGLTVPHARLEERAFALLPLLDVAPDAKHPVTGRAYSAIAIDRSGARAVGTLDADGP